LPQKIIKRFGDDLTGITIGIWGLAFKPGTDDMREAPSLILIEEVIKRGGSVRAYDPEAMPVARTMIASALLSSGQVVLTDQQYDALQGVDALALVTEWKPFAYPDISMMQDLMKGNVIFDGRNQYNPVKMREAGFEYYGIGREWPANAASIHGASAAVGS
jgi:UDPglucose 6-dehydrogenase